MPNEASPRLNLASVVNNFEQCGNDVAVVVRHGLRRRACSYAELAQICRRFAAMLVQRNISKGDRVLIWAPNGPEWIGAFFGCVLRGVLPVPLDEAGSATFAARVERETSPKLIVTSSAHTESFSSTTPLLTTEDLLTVLPQTPDFSTANLGANDPLQIIFTSGTTGDPKGIVHTHGNVLASLGPIEREIGKYRKYERIFHPLRFLHTLPLSHVFGQFMGLWIPSLIGAEVHFDDRLLASELIGRIQNERISVLAAVPRVLDLMREHVRQRFPDIEKRREQARGASALKRWWIFRDVHRLLGVKFWSLVCGGAALPTDLEEFWNSLGFVVVQGYGMTETTALVSLNHPFRAARGSLGQILPGREIQLSPDGEVLVRGETVSSTVWQDGRAQSRDSEWLATGDLAELDESGNLRFRGRKKDVIVTAAGLNIHPDDLEAALLRQPEVKACTVIEVQGEHGPEPLAVLIMRDGDPASAVAAANRTLATYQRISRWMVWPEPDLPRTSTGKVLRREVARIVTAGSTNSQQAKGSLASLLDRVSLGHAETDSTVTGQELNLDSLARVELQASIEEQFGLTVDDNAIQNVRTVTDLQNILKHPAAPMIQDRGEPESDRIRHIYPEWPWAPLLQLVRSLFLETVMRPFVKILANPRVDSATDAAAKAPLLIYANHVTAVDVALILNALPGPIRRHTAVAMSGEILLSWRQGRYYRYQLLNWISPLEYLVVTALFNVFPLPQKSGFRKSFAHAGKAMDRGYNILVFPEGRRSTDETIQTFMSGSGLLWTDLKCPALPVYLAGLGELKRTNAGWFRSRKLGVRVGSPITLPPGVSPEQATALLESALRQLASRHH